MEAPSLPMQLAKAVLLAAVMVAVLFPFVYVLAVSFSSERDILGGGLILFPQHPTLEAYQALLRGGVVVRSLEVSVGLVTIGTTVKMLFTIALAYGLSKSGVPGAKPVLLMVLGTLLFSPGLIPSYLLVKGLGMIDTYQSLILPGLISAFNLIVLRNFFMNIPQELLEAARLDGASDWQVLWRLVLPLSAAALAVVALFYGVGIWDAFFNAILYLNERQQVADSGCPAAIRAAGQRARFGGAVGPQPAAATDGNHPDGDHRARHRTDSAGLPLLAAVLHQGRADRRHQGVTAPKEERPQWTDNDARRD